MNSILLPAISLVVWSLIMQIWMMATRVPAIFKARRALDPNALRGAQMNTLPPQVRWKADNYNNLMEQPTLFYAVTLILAVSGNETQFTIGIAWAYVGLRVVHSLVQSLVNIVKVRFAFFMMASLTLMILTVRTLLSLI